MFDVITDMMSNLTIDEDEKMSTSNSEVVNMFPIKYSYLLDNISKFVVNEPTFKMEIIDNIFIIDNILFGLRKKPLSLINLNLDDEKYNDNKNKPLYIAVLHLPEFRDENIPQKFDTNWWDSN